LKIIFAGTPQFAASALEALLAQGYAVAAVLTQPDRPAGRGMQLAFSPVKQLALAHELTVLQPMTLKQVDIQQKLAECGADLMVVAAYGLILPAAVLQLPRHGCFNIHASLLPRWRGAAPIQRAILAGDEETGITIMQMDTGLDTGAMLLKTPCGIAPHDNAQTLHDKLAKLGAEALIEALHLLKLGRLRAIPQDAALATYAAKLSKAEAQLDWTADAAYLARAVRAYNPSPIAWAIYDETPIKIWQASVRNEHVGPPGTLLECGRDGVVVACGRGALALEILQRPNARALPAAQFLQGFSMQTGASFARAA
jgi:methionyl-tRNA formyltransferase